MQKIVSYTIQKRGEEKMDKLLTIEEVAETLKVSKPIILQLRKKGLLKFMKLGRLKVRERTLDEFLERYDGQDVNAILHSENTPLDAK